MNLWYRYVHGYDYVHLYGLCDSAHAQQPVCVCIHVRMYVVHVQTSTECEVLCVFTGMCVNMSMYVCKYAHTS